MREERDHYREKYLELIRERDELLATLGRIRDACATVDATVPDTVDGEWFARAIVDRLAFEKRRADERTEELEALRREWMLRSAP